MTDPLIGKEIDGYLVEALLGEGGMARVYRAIDVNLQRYVAFKVISPQAPNPKKYEKRFNNEAQAVAKLNHPNIVTVFRFQKVKELYYLAMTYIDGADLRWVMHNCHQERKALDYPTIRGVMQQITAALDYAHKRGVIHRDVKPSNIMIARDNNAILTDFGLALITQEGSKGEIFGSPHYISPEQVVNSATVVPQSDLYSLGVVLYEMLTGDLHKPPPNPRELNPNIHSAFIPMLEKALEKDANQRFVTGKAFMKALDKAIAAALSDPEVSKKRPVNNTTLAARIAHNFSPLPTPPQLVAVNGSSWPSFTQMAPDDAVVKTKVQKQRQRRPAVWLILILLIVFMSWFGIQANSLLNEQVTSFAQPRADGPAFIEGRLQAQKGNVLTIYDIPVIISQEESFLDELVVGKMLRIEGEFAHTAQGIQFTSITRRVIDGVEYELDGSGESNN